MPQVNNYDKDVFNGDQGVVVAASPDSRSLVVRFPHLAGRAEAHGPVVARAAGAPGGSGAAPHEDPSLRSYSGMELLQLELAYAVTVHKAQGGEAARVVLALSPAHARMLTRRLLYTGGYGWVAAVVGRKMQSMVMCILFCARHAQRCRPTPPA